MLSSKRLELLLTLEQRRRDQCERLCAGRRAELQTLMTQRAQLESLLAQYQSAQTSFRGAVSQLRQQVRLSERLLNGIEELAGLAEAAQQRLELAEATLRHSQQRCDGWQRQLTKTRAAERRSWRRRERRKLERRWLEGRREQSEI
ncbi:MAG: hypothetical protein AAGG11_22695 [Pseudomonadota bacterium]